MQREEKSQHPIVRNTNPEFWERLGCLLGDREERAQSSETPENNKVQARKKSQAYKQPM